MTYSTEQIVNLLEEACDLRTFDVGKFFKRRGFGWKLRKTVAYFVGCCRVTFWKRRERESVYLPANSKSGLVYDLAIAVICRIRKFDCFYHHHVYDYIETADLKMKMIRLLMGRRCTHIMACPAMISDFERIYGRINATTVVPSIVPARGGTSRNNRETFTLGHLSNLSTRKGLVEVLQLFERVVATGRQVRLILAGPCHGPDSEKIIKKALQKHKQRVEYRGPTFGEAKEQFFREIDAFAFPTKAESWGIVLNEALAFGVPVLTVKLACIPHLVGDAGLLVGRDENFVDVSAPVLLEWIDNDRTYSAMVDSALDRANQLEEEAMNGMQHLVSLITKTSTK